MEFTASGSPRSIADGIEQSAVAQGNMTALVVPWESQHGMLSIAVTAVKGDGWAIEHTNLGTIRLTDLGNDLTRVAIVPIDPDHPDGQKLARVFDRFEQQIQERFRAAS